eukprot:RCo007753
MHFRAFLGTLSDMVQRNRGKEVAALLRDQAGQCASEIGRFADITAVLRNHLSPNWAEAFGSFLRALCAEMQSNEEDAFNFGYAALLAYRKQWSEPSEKELPRPNWSVPILEVFLNRVRLWATICDGRKGADGEKLNKASHILRQFFADCQSDRSGNLEVSRKLGTLVVMNNLFKIYFRMNNVRLSKALIKNVEADESHTFKFYPMAQKVTYHYYLGRVNMFDGNFSAAETSLQFAFEHCHPNYLRNKTRILLFLITVKLVRGKFPRPELLRRYKLTLFSDLVAACRTGNVRLFDSAMDKNQEMFIRKGIYVILQKAKVICYRNLVVNVYRIVDSFRTGVNFRLKLEYIRMALLAMGVREEEADLDEIECILANLIFQSYVKGYIAHKQRTLVLSKQAPFSVPANMA